VLATFIGSRSGFTAMLTGVAAYIAALACIALDRRAAS